MENICSNNKIMDKKKAKFAFKCKVCDRIGHYHYYGVRCCEGCKQFFRRVVIGCKLYSCAHKKECPVDAANRCRACRFDQCLLVGMDANLVTPIDHNFLNFLQNYKMNLMQTKKSYLSEPQTFDNSGVFLQFLNFLIPIERAYHRIWDSPMTLPASYTDRHESLRVLLSYGHNLLENSIEYVIEPNVIWDKSAFIEEMQQKGLYTNNYLIKTATKDYFLAIEIFRTMPFFKMLDLDDQISQLRHIFIPITLLFGAYYAYAISAKTVTRGNGFTPISFLEMKQFENDQKIRDIASYCLIEMVERMAKAQIDYHEFLLLFVILFASSTADNLSACGRDLLYSESACYSKALLKMLQTKFDAFVGFEKFASLLNLLEICFRAKQHFCILLVYIEVFYEKRSPMASQPKALEALTTN